ncbi:MAG: YncE family protein [Bacteroidales bacterium]
MKNIIKLAFLLPAIISCTKMKDLPPSDYIMEGGVFIVNEGNYRGGNGSLSFYSYDSSKIYNDLFSNINGRPLGDVPNAMAIKGDKAYIVVNNSGKIEVLDQATLKSAATIGGLISPRNISFISDYKAYVSSLYSDSVTIINLQTNSISGYINIRRSSESIAVAGNKAFISNWSGGKEIMVISTFNDKVIDSIEVGPEPESMAIDKNAKLWVLCDGGWTKQNFAELDVINLESDIVEKKFVFPTLQDSPSCLKIESTGQIIYYLDNGVKQMDISSDKLPETTLIAESGASFYKIAINPVNNDIFITDAVDFVQQGWLLLYKNDGSFVMKQRAGIIPGSMCFKLTFSS